jgi:hypothetical protein
MSRWRGPVLKTLNDRVEWARSHGACDPGCEGRCVVCPRDVIDELMDLVTVLDAKGVAMAQGIERTPWFDAYRAYPVRSGWYEFRYRDGHTESLFWSVAMHGWRNGIISGYSMRALPGDQWRGLTAPYERGR